MRDTALRVLVVGAGGHAQTVTDVLLCMREKGLGIEPIGLLDDNPALVGHKVLGLSVLGVTSTIGRIAHDAVVIAIGSNEKRKRVFEQLRVAGERFAVVRHPDTIVSKGVIIGPGTVIHQGVIIETGTSIGANAILSSSSSVSHNTCIEDHTHIGFGTRIGAELVVAEGAMVGMGATVISRRNIGAWCVVGAGACVTKSVPERVTVVGVPARLLDKKEY